MRFLAAAFFALALLAPTGEARAQHFGDVVRGRLTLVGEIGGQDHFPDLPFGGARQQPVEADLAGAHPVERRQAPHQDEIHPGIGKRLLDHRQVGRRLDNAQQRTVAPRRAAERAHLVLAEVVALGAALHARQRVGQGSGEFVRPRALVLTSSLLRSNALDGRL